MEGYKKFLINTISDMEKGKLSYFQVDQDIDFKLNRIYYIYQVPSGVIRGEHAHKRLKQVLFCPIGGVSIMLDDGVKVERVILDNPDKGLLIGGGIWRNIEFMSLNTVLVVGVSDKYDENDYIRDYNKFLELVKGGFWE